MFLNAVGFFVIVFIAQAASCLSGMLNGEETEKAPERSVVFTAQTSNRLHTLAHTRSWKFLRITKVQLLPLRNPNETL